LLVARATGRARERKDAQTTGIGELPRARRARDATSLGALALVLASVGIYGVVAPMLKRTMRLVVAGVAVAAGTLPARRAARIDPSRTLHYE